MEGVKILPQKFPKIGLAAFVDFFDVQSAVEAKETKHKLNGQEVRTNFKTKSSEKFGEKKQSDDDEVEDKKGNDQRRYRDTCYSLIVLCIVRLCAGLLSTLSST